ncbi:Protein N-acetyltransferase, RimJ/RimL family [Lentzea fradiae]|uniref:Protein N-acetyltransferase, RimJ/RimL family n=1 Tax=Lentzea fradiae TaxID=200378 RepID=A0A1G7PWW2_9PSEU|nr:GNAT family protein [Lentzea fradiae]SDF90715.1 Protein N-acetyltransferase, RimJ/RimL family [Lentzea fradiae]
MEPVEINAGEHYLRAFRTDDRIDDVPVLAAVFADPVTARYARIDGVTGAEGFVEMTTTGWEEDRSWSWAVCDAVSAEVVAGIVLHDIDAQAGSARVTCWTHPARPDEDALPTSLDAVLGWAFGAADLRRVVFRHPASDEAARRLAQRCGFTPQGRLPGGETADDQGVDELVWSRTAEDRLP